MNAAGFLDPGAGRAGASVPALRHVTGPDRAGPPARPLTAGPWGRYVAMGDSFTAGMGDPEPLSPGGMRGWADRIAEELGGRRPDFRYANLAVSGLVLREILDRQLEPAIALKPDLVTLSAGGNDIVFHRSDPDRLAATLDTAVGLLSGTGATIVLFTGPDWRHTPLLGHNRGRVAVFNENIRTIAARHHGVIADLWTLRQLSDPRMWDPDRLHFSPLGHHTIAAMVLEALGAPHTLVPLVPKPMPAESWRDSKAGDLAWFTTYLLPWMVKRVRKRPDAPAPAPKRPEPGPVYGSGGAVSLP